MASKHWASPVVLGLVLGAAAGAHAAPATRIEVLSSRPDMISGPPPKVISDLIVKALQAKRPATRYHGGGLAAPLLFMRRHMSDRMFDSVIMSAFRRRRTRRAVKPVVDQPHAP